MGKTRGGLVLAVLGLVACSGTVEPPAQGEAASSGREALTRIPIPRSVVVPSIPPVRMPPDMLCPGGVKSGVAALVSTWSCPDVPVDGGVLVGFDGRTWLVGEGQGSSDPDAVAHFSMTLSLNGWLTPALLDGSQPFCVYAFRPSDSSIVADFGWGWADRASLGSVGAQALAPTCESTGELHPGHNPCPNCTNGVNGF